MLPIHREEIGLDSLQLGIWRELQLGIWRELTKHSTAVLLEGGIGDMMTFLDKVGYPYPPAAENAEIARSFKIAYSEYIINEVLAPIGKEFMKLVLATNERY